MNNGKAKLKKKDFQGVPSDFSKVIKMYPDDSKALN
jgi:hypothetical protein